MDISIGKWNHNECIFLIRKIPNTRRVISIHNIDMDHHLELVQPLIVGVGDPIQLQWDSHRELLRLLQFFPTGSQDKTFTHYQQTGNTFYRDHVNVIPEDENFNVTIWFQFEDSKLVANDNINHQLYIFHIRDKLIWIL